MDLEFKKISSLKNTHPLTRTHTHKIISSLLHSLSLSYPLFCNAYYILWSIVDTPDTKFPARSCATLLHLIDAAADAAYTNSLSI